jgi:uncharacterized repeat protein (TIGR01451 family)
MSRVASAILIAGFAGGMVACESTSGGSSGSGARAPLGVGSGSPSFLYRPSQQAAKPAPRAEEPAPARAAEPAPRRVSNACNYSPNAGAGMTVVGMPFPTGDAASSAIMLHQVMPAEVRRNAEFGYEYHVTNLTGGTLQNVAVVLESQSNLDVINSAPAAMTGAAGSTWSLGDLGPCETKVIRLTARARETGQAGNCVSVSYNNSLCAATTVVDPSLAIEKKATPRVLKCDPITLTYNVCNTGTGMTTGVVVRDTLPAGLTVNGSRNVEIPVGDLAAGECREVSVVAMASGTGEYCSPASASSSDGLTANSGDPCTVVVAPKLAITCNARDNQYINRNSEFEFEVTNTGDGVAANTVVNVALPAGAEFVSASSGATPAGGAIAFPVGDLAPGQSKTVSVNMVSRVAGSIRVAASAGAACADPVNTACETEYRGIPAILLEVVDLVDPVEVGQETTYVIRVTNQGSADDTNVVVKCILPDEMAYVSATGATSARVDGQSVTFGTESVLNPQEVVEWRLTVRATGEGDVRFAVEMTSEQFQRPIRETESTNLYR